MSDNINKNEIEKPIEATAVTDNEKSKNDNAFRFFKCCSTSLKRFSVVLFIINIFFSVILIGVILVLIGVKIGFNMLPLLALPVITVFIILVIFARLISALVYGFAEIVEKHEDK